MKIDKLAVSAFTLPTATPESDGTFEWNKTTLVVVEADAGSTTGLGYTYANKATARTIKDVLEKAVVGRDPFDIPASYRAMHHAIRNLGRPGIDAMAISAVDVALWDLKARLLELPLAKLLGQTLPYVSAYGSGGFTSYDNRQLQAQFAHWAEMGLRAFKMKVGRDPRADLERVRAAREAIGVEPELYVDANGAYTRKQALAQAEAFADFSIGWLEEPVSSDDLEGLRLLRDRGPAGMDIAAGEYGYDIFYFRRMLEAQAVDVLQIDASRAGGITGFLAASALAKAHGLETSAHTAPSLHTPVCAAVGSRNIEYFFDHARIEQLLFDGALSARGGVLRPDLTRPGLGLELKRRDAERYAA